MADKPNFEDIKKLKNMTGVGMNDAKAALEEAGGNFDEALEQMRVKGIAKADKKAGRTTGQGLVHAYVHDGRIGVLVEVNCETDFVARTDEFKDFVNDMALQVAASAPMYVSSDQVTDDDRQQELKLIHEELKNEGKPEEMIEKISQGKIKRWESEICLMDQEYIKDPQKTVDEVRKETIAQLGENISVARFSRMELGQE